MGFIGLIVGKYRKISIIIGVLVFLGVGVWYYKKTIYNSIFNAFYRDLLEQRLDLELKRREEDKIRRSEVVQDLLEADKMNKLLDKTYTDIREQLKELPDEEIDPKTRAWLELYYSGKLRDQTESNTDN